MRILNRSAIIVVPKKPFICWANGLTPQFPMAINGLGESHTYFTNPDFEDADKHIKKYFDEIFIEELNGIWTNQNDWPKKEISKLSAIGSVLKCLIGYKI